jgi:hypothetical protein
VSSPGIHGPRASPPFWTAIASPTIYQLGRADRVVL